jgi:anti-sigma factor RsiW
MKITRDVVYDLLPAYFAGELSADSRALIDEFFASDPEFGRMAERFRTLMEERSRPGVAQTATEQERTSFESVRSRANLRQMSVIWTIAAVLTVGLAFIVGRGHFSFRNPGFIIAVIWAFVAAGCWIALFINARGTGSSLGRWWGGLD